MQTTSSIFYVEDDMVLASVTCRSLVKRGYQVHHFSSVTAARLGVHAEKYSFALLDLKLEDGSSLELIEQLMAAYADIKILILTGYASIATAVQAIKLGAVNYLSKPASIEQILRAFDKHAEITNAEQKLSEAEETLPLRRMEWEHIHQALQENNGNISATARQLKMHRRTLQRKLGKKPLA